MFKLSESSIFDYARYVFSFALLVFSTVVPFYAILEQKTAFWKACFTCSMASSWNDTAIQSVAS